MVIRLEFVQHWLPLWFLVGALFLPRIALLILHVHGSLHRFEITVSLIPLLVWLLLPRALVLYLIYLDQGISLWFIVHLLVALMVWGGSSSYHSRRWRRESL